MKCSLVGPSERGYVRSRGAQGAVLRETPLAIKLWAWSHWVALVPSPAPPHGPGAVGVLCGVSVSSWLAHSFSGSPVGSLCSRESLANSYLFWGFIQSNLRVRHLGLSCNVSFSRASFSFLTVSGVIAELFPAQWAGFPCLGVCGLLCIPEVRGNKELGAFWP